MTFPNPFGFYGIVTDPHRGYEYLCKLMVDYEIPFIQLRMKKETRKEIYKMAECYRKITEGSASRFILNDHADIALDVCADGVHVGQDDEKVHLIREKAPKDFMVGLSTHNPTQTEEGCKQLPDYIGVGPVFKTPTKAIADPVLGVVGMAAMLKLATVPAVAIGAIDASNLREVMHHGARNFSAVRPVNHVDKPEPALKALLALYRECLSELQ